MASAACHAGLFSSPCSSTRWALARRDSRRAVARSAGRGENSAAAARARSVGRGRGLELEERRGGGRLARLRDSRREGPCC